jgi:hypothetical protein
MSGKIDASVAVDPSRRSLQLVEYSEIMLVAEPDASHESNVNTKHGVMVKLCEMYLRLGIPICLPRLNPRLSLPPHARARQMTRWCEALGIRLRLRLSVTHCRDRGAPCGR